MPDYSDIECYYCLSIENYSVQVESNTKQGEYYTVRHEKLTAIEAEVQETTHGWTCTCKSFQYRGKPCVHINTVRWHQPPLYCGWYGLHKANEPFLPIDRDTGKPICPKCGGPCGVRREAV